VKWALLTEENIIILASSYERSIAVFRFSN